MNIKNNSKNNNSPSPPPPPPNSPMSPTSSNSSPSFNQIFPALFISQPFPSLLTLISLLLSLFLWSFTFYHFYLLYHGLTTNLQIQRERKKEMEKNNNHHHNPFNEMNSSSLLVNSQPREEKNFQSSNLSSTVEMEEKIHSSIPFPLPVHSSASSSSSSGLITSTSEENSSNSSSSREFNSFSSYIDEGELRGNSIQGGNSSKYSQLFQTSPLISTKFIESNEKSVQIRGILDLWKFLNESTPESLFDLRGSKEQFGKNFHEDENNSELKKNQEKYSMSKVQNRIALALEEDDEEIDEFKSRMDLP